jgi:hypothetical protein
MSNSTNNSCKKTKTNKSPLSFIVCAIILLSISIYCVKNIGNVSESKEELKENIKKDINNKNNKKIKTELSLKDI